MSAEKRIAEEIERLKAQIAGHPSDTEEDAMERKRLIAQLEAHEAELERLKRDDG